MTKIEKLQAVAQSLSDAQMDALIAFAQSMGSAPFFHSAPPEALASIERGLEQAAAGKTVSLDALSTRLRRLTDQG